MDKGLWSRLLKGMKNDELAILSSLIYGEQRRRAEKRIKEGRFVELNENEQVMLQEVGRARTTIEYRNRTNCPLMMAKMVVDLADSPHTPKSAGDVEVTR